MVCLLLSVSAAVPVRAQDRISAPQLWLSGRVSNTIGMPVPAVRMRVCRPSRTVSPQSVWAHDTLQTRCVSLGHGVTDADGRYRVPLTVAGPYRLQASALGYASMYVELARSHGSRAPLLELERSNARLPRVSISGRSPKERAAVPGATSVVGGDVLRVRAPLSLAEALRTMPGIHVADEDPYGLALNIAFRGLQPRRSSRTLLLEDGMPILLGPYGDPAMHYAPPIESLDRVEIVKGSGQIMNGPQTSGGVVNFVTTGPPVSGPVAEVFLGGGALDFRNARMRVGSGNEAIGAAIEYTHREGAGIREEQAHQMQQLALSGRVSHGTAHSTWLKLSHWREASITSETGLTQSEFASNPYALPFAADGRFNVERSAAQLMHESRVGRMTIVTNVYGSRAERASWRQSGSSQERLGGEDYADDFNCEPDADTYQQCGNQGRPRTYELAGVEPRVHARFGTPHRGVALDGGLRLYTESVRRRQYVGDTPTSQEPNAELTRDNSIGTNATAGFLQARANWAAVSLSPALRVERVTQRIRNRFPGMEAGVHQAYTQLLPGVGASIVPSPAFTIFAGAHRGFAPPRPADIYRPEPGQAVLLVDPETSVNLELGVRTAPHGSVQLEFTAFEMTFGNQIIEAPANAGQRFVNGGRTVHRGFEVGGHVALAALRAELPDLTVRGAYTALPVARFQSGAAHPDAIVGNRLPYAPTHTGSASIALTIRSFSVGTSAEYVSPQVADRENTRTPSEDGQDGILPAYSVFGAFGTYSVPDRRLQLRASVRNLLDQLYITQRNEGIITGVRRLARIELQWTY